MSNREREEFLKMLEKGLSESKGWFKSASKIKKTLTMGKTLDNLLIYLLGRMMMKGSKFDYSSLVQHLIYTGLAALGADSDLFEESELTAFFKEGGTDVDRLFGGS